jgi:hypothetical protein
MAQLDRHALHMLDAEMHVLPHVVARPLSERLPVEEALRPVAVALVPVVRLLHPERHPAEPRLGEKIWRSGKRSKTPERIIWARLIAEAVPRKGRATHSTMVRPPGGRSPWSAPGNSSVGNGEARRSKPTCTVSGIFIAVAAAQNRSSAGVG